MSNNRWMDKEDVIYIYIQWNISHKKEQNWVICRDADGPRNCYTEWSKVSIFDEASLQALGISGFWKKWMKTPGLTDICQPDLAPGIARQSQYYFTSTPYSQTQSSLLAQTIQLSFCLNFPSNLSSKSALPQTPSAWPELGVFTACYIDLAW